MRMRIPFLFIIFFLILITGSCVVAITYGQNPGQSLVIVRFLVGTPQEDALIKVYSKLYSNFDRMSASSSF